MARWYSSDLTAAVFARKIGVRETTLRWWAWRLKSKRDSAARAASAVSPLTFVEMTTSVPSEPLEVVLMSGVRIRLAPDFDADAMKRLLDVLDRR